MRSHFNIISNMHSTYSGSSWTSPTRFPCSHRRSAPNSKQFAYSQPSSFAANPATHYTPAQLKYI